MQWLSADSMVLRYPPCRGRLPVPAQHQMRLLHLKIRRHLCQVTLPRRARPRWLRPQLELLALLDPRARGSSRLAVKSVDRVTCGRLSTRGLGVFPPAFDTIRRQPDWTVKLLNSDVKYTYKAKRMLSYILRRKTAEGNVDTVLEELQNDFSAVNGGMVKRMKVKQSLFGDDVSAFTQRIAKPSASIQTHRTAPVVHQVPVDGSTLVHVSS